MRDREFLLRQKEIGNKYLTDQQVKEIKRLLDQGVSHKVINTIFGTSYKQLKEIRKC